MPGYFDPKFGSEPETREWRGHRVPPEPRNHPGVLFYTAGLGWLTPEQFKLRAPIPLEERPASPSPVPPPRPVFGEKFPQKRSRRS